EGAFESLRYDRTSTAQNTLSPLHTRPHAHAYAHTHTHTHTQTYTVSSVQLETAWCINPKRRTGQLVPTQNEFLFFSVRLVWLAHLRSEEHTSELQSHLN